MFAVDESLVAKASRILAGLTSVYWIVGGACSGKTTVCHYLSETRGLQVFDMDRHIYGMYQKLYSPSRHPANEALFSAQNPLEWALSLSMQSYDELQRACDAEYLDLFSDDAEILFSGAAEPHEPLLVDGGITHPSILARVLPAARILCLRASGTEGRSCWESTEPRRTMKETILKLPGAESAWETFLAFDRSIHRTITRECRQHRIKTLPRDDSTPVETLCAAILEHFGI